MVLVTTVSYIFTWRKYVNNNMNSSNSQYIVTLVEQKEPYTSNVAFSKYHILCVEKSPSPVNIFHNKNYRLTTLSSARYKNLLFCVPKAAVLHGKSVGFALQKSRFGNVKSKLLFP
ncbi:hypothetical protein CTM45_08575 [Prevotella intermedia]|uniref:Uncharacterized protein n=2 Tax=Prevotella intermedia TaxID=28131 RepID=A0A2D3LIN3_PREIN|nr:hypothetical protein CTM46_02495 [Prevotella intermedia]PJI23326.1 hypothetical protein CTM45_08575 [Prevotella intermedia]